MDTGKCHHPFIFVLGKRVRSISIQDRKNGGKWDIGAMGSVTAGQSKSDALELRILLYIYCKSWDPRGDPLYVGLSDQLRDGLVGPCVQVLSVPSACCCPPWNTALASRGFGRFSVELSQFWWNHRLGEALPKLSGHSAAEPTHRSAGGQWPVWEGTRVTNYRRLPLKIWAFS